MVHPTKCYLLARHISFQASSVKRQVNFQTSWNLSNTLISECAGTDELVLGVASDCEAKLHSDCFFEGGKTE